MIANSKARGPPPRPRSGRGGDNQERRSVNQVNERLARIMEERDLDVDTLRERLEQAGHRYSREHFRRVMSGRRTLTQRTFRVVVEALEVDNEVQRDLCGLYVYCCLES
jgi:hypothetical protein